LVAAAQPGRGLPLGTGNDFAGHLGLDGSPQEAVTGLVDGEPQAMDLVVTDDDRVVVNAAHLGIGVTAAERSADLKDLFGQFAYPLGALAAGVAADGLDLRVRLDGERLDLERPALMVVIANGRTIGGGTALAPEARADDGLLDVVVVHAVEPTARAAFAAAMLRGTHLDRDEVAVGRGRAVTVSGSSLAHNRDGELEEMVDTTRTYRVEPGARRLVASVAVR